MVQYLRKTTHLFVMFSLMLVALPQWSYGDSVDLPDGSKLDTAAACPVCKMKVGAGEIGPAAVVFQDGKVVPFDGGGDLFRYLLSPSKYGFTPSNIKAIFVTDYGTKKFIDAKSAYYVLGSNLTGGMGLEAIAFSRKEDAEKLKSERKGTRVTGYTSVTLNDLQTGKKKMMKMKH